MNIYILAFSNDDAGNNGYYKLCQLQGNYHSILISNNTIVIFVSSKCNLNLSNLITQIKRTYNVQGPTNVYLLAPEGHTKNPICNNYNDNVILKGTSGTFLTNYVYPVLNKENVQNIVKAVANIQPIVFDPLIIIFTEQITDRTGKIRGWGEWLKAINTKADFYNNKFKKFSPKNKKDKEKIRIVEFKVGDYTVLFVKENSYGADKGGINNLLSQILNQKQWKNFPKEDIYVAVHALNEYAKGKDVDGFKNEFKNRVNYICDFHHSDDVPLYKEFCGGDSRDSNCALIKLLTAVGKNNKETAKSYCEEIIELIRKMSGKDIRDLSLLKHQIVNLLEPIKIDIDGLMEKKFEDKYWKKVSNYWRGERVDKIFENIEKVIINKKNSKEEVKNFVQEISDRINKIKNLFKVSELLTALKNNDKKTVRNICELYGNIYKKWMDELINEFEKMKSNLE